MKLKYFSGFAILFTLFSCTFFNNWETIYQTDYKGQNFILQSNETKGFSTNSFTWRFKLGDMPYVNIDANTFDWGPPYSTDIFAEKSYLYLTNKGTAYINQPKFDSTTHTFLYFDPKKISETEFENYYQFMKENWSTIDSKFAGTDLRSFPSIIGIAYGTNNQFVKEFKGKIKYLGSGELKPYILKVFPDGRVSFELDEKGGGVEFSGFSNVIMPGKIINYKKDSNYNLETLNQLKDKYGNNISKYFDIKSN